MYNIYSSKYNTYILGPISVSIYVKGNFTIPDYIETLKGMLSTRKNIGIHLVPEAGVS